MESEPGTKPVVLILEDNPRWQQVLCGLLDAKRYEILTALSLSRALDILHSRAIDVAIIDLSMRMGDDSDRGGLAFVSALDDYYDDDRTHGIIVTSYAKDDDYIKTGFQRPSHNIKMIFRKSQLNAQKDEFSREVASAARATRSARETRATMQIRHTLSPRFLSDISLDNLISSLAPRAELWNAKRDLNSLLFDLLVTLLPLAREVRVEAEFSQEHEAIRQHIFCWSRKQVRALDVALALSRSREGLQPAPRWAGQTAVQKTYQLAGQYFEGAVFELPDVKFEQFYSIISENGSDTARS